VRIEDIQPLSAFPEPKPIRDGHVFGNWKYCAELKVLRYRDRFGYEVDLERMETAAAVLDWVFHVSNKTWCSPLDISDLIEAIRALVNPQASLCSWGIANAGSKR